jgi:hypothetical protein
MFAASRANNTALIAPKSGASAASRTSHKKLNRQHQVEEPRSVAPPLSTEWSEARTQFQCEGARRADQHRGGGAGSSVIGLVGQVAHIGHEAQ